MEQTRNHSHVPLLSHSLTLPRRLLSALQTFLPPQVTDADIKTFESMLAPERVLTQADDVAAFNSDWLRQYRGSSTVVLRPKTTEEASAVLAHCNARNLAVNLQVGGPDTEGRRRYMVRPSHKLLDHRR